MRCRLCHGRIMTTSLVISVLKCKMDGTFKDSTNGNMISMCGFE